MLEQAYIIRVKHAANLNQPLLPVCDPYPSFPASLATCTEPSDVALCIYMYRIAYFFIAWTMLYIYIWADVSSAAASELAEVGDSCGCSGFLPHHKILAGLFTFVNCPSSVRASGRIGDRNWQGCGENKMGIV